MRLQRSIVVLLALAATSPAAAQVYHLDDGVVRVHHGSTTVPDRVPAPVRQPKVARAAARTELAYVPAAPVNPSEPRWSNAAAAPLLDQAAEQTGLHPALIEALVWQESRWHPDAVSPKGAIGLTQLMPGTARELGVDPRDPTANLLGGARYLRNLLDHFDGDLVKALAAYNAGVRRVEEAGGVPPIRETQQYVLGILTRVTAMASRR